MIGAKVLTLATTATAVKVTNNLLQDVGELKKQNALLKAENDNMNREMQAMLSFVSNVRAKVDAYYQSSEEKLSELEKGLLKEAGRDANQLGERMTHLQAVQTMIDVTASTELRDPKGKKQWDEMLKILAGEHHEQEAREAKPLDGDEFHEMFGFGDGRDAAKAKL